MSERTPGGGIMTEDKAAILAYVRWHPGVTEVTLTRVLDPQAEPGFSRIGKAIASLWLSSDISIEAHCVYLDAAK